MSELGRELESYGVAPQRFVSLDAASAETLDYLDLVSGPDGALLDGVIPGNSGPTLYLVREDRLATSVNVSIIPLLHKLACRGEAALLAVLRPGVVDVYPVGFAAQLAVPQSHPRTSAGLRPLFADLAAGASSAVADDGQAVAAQRAVHELLFKLIQDVTTHLRRTRSLRNHPDVVFALVGRALFARFLIDRGIMTREQGPTLPAGVELVDCFSTPQAATKTCQWLDAVFNGDLLPLWSGKYSAGFKRLHLASPKALGVLSNLVRREPNGQLTFDELWKDLDFGHIPVGLLSEVYERYAHDVFPEHAESESVHYTPRGIARFVVNQAFDGLTMDDPSRARVLDPAAGAGVFLVLAYRRLVQERWRRQERRPSSKELRSILMDQLGGFDINEYALKLAALGLYLTVLELDPPGEAPRELTFGPLIGRVLRPTRAQGETFPSRYPVAGSLGDAVPSSMNGTWDLAVSNPPWTSWRAPKSTRGAQAVAQLNALASNIAKRVARVRLPNEAAPEIERYTNPDKVPDLPFLWRSAEWVKPGGSLAFVMHGRLLFKRSKQGSAARNLLFRCLRITGVVNGADLAGTRAWPGVNVPFAVLFAKNTSPTWSDSFHFVNPYRDASTAPGRIRVDANDAVSVQQQLVIEQPQILKTLYRGGRADSEIVRRIHDLGFPTLKQYWEEELELQSGIGLQTSSSQSSARSLQGMPYLTADTEERLVINVRRLPRFARARVHRVRDERIYKGPLVVFREAALEDQQQRALLSDADCLFNRSFVGFSAHGAGQDARALTDYLLTLGVSNFVMYYSLLTSSKFGVDRKVLHTEDFDALPIKPLARLTEQERDTLRVLSTQMRFGGFPGEAIDKFVFGLYGLSEPDIDAIRDTLATRAPYESAFVRATSAPSDSDVERFRSRLERQLEPFFLATEDRVAVRRIVSAESGWRFLHVGMNSADTLPATIPTELLAGLGDATSSSVVRFMSSPGNVYLAILAQGRYWTQTRARLLGVSLLRSGENLFPVAPAEQAHP